MSKLKPKGPDDQKPAKVPQKHGGALYAGGVKGNRSHLGQTSKVRALMLGDALTTRKELIKFIRKQEPCPSCGRRTSTAEMTRMLEVFLKYSVGAAKATMEPELLKELAEAVARTFDATPEQMEALYKAWAPTLGRHAAGEA